MSTKVTTQVTSTEKLIILIVSWNNGASTTLLLSPNEAIKLSGQLMLEIAKVKDTEE